MSFITKRERVFNEYDLYDLPARNEGKLKAYASCTDARAWSHFCSDKSEHLVEIIKRNNDTGRPKYVPTEAIVNTLLAHKHAEIARLKRKIEEFEQMLAAYDELELTPDQKCEIAKAHASIKEANKDLNELWFDLNLSGFTGIDSDDFETGKSRGDEPTKYDYKEERDESDETPRSKGDEWSFEKEPSIEKESKGNQASVTKCLCDKSTYAEDPRIKELQECIITKDAKLNAMRNTNAVIENDVCEPYCIYAHIYTALEKILGVLYQNDKYKLYLNLMTAGKDIRCIDIKGKILFKLKVLEKFSLALLSPCSQGSTSPQKSPDQSCSCYRAEVIADIEAAYALTSAETQLPGLDTKRAQLIADIMENEEMKEIINKDSVLLKSDLNEEDIDTGYNIDQENLKRIKNLQESYDDLITCHEALKHEKACLQIRCQKYDELEKQFESVQNQLREYNSLWNEKEHYRKRSQDLDSLKEQYMVLCDETTSLENELKAETEIKNVKNKTIEELRIDNIALEKRLNEVLIAFEKERNSAHCKLKESECTIMCQEQQIKSLSLQIDRLLEQDPDRLQSKQSETPDISLIDEMNSLKEQIKNLQDALFCSEEEKQQLQEEYQNKLNLINDIKMELEDRKSSYEEALQRNQYLEKYTDSFRDEVQKLIDENRILSQDVQEKSNAIENLISVLNNKSQEVDKLMEDIDAKSKENNNLYAEITNIHDSYNKIITDLDSDKSNVERSLQLAKRESEDLIEKIKEYDSQQQKQDNLSYLYQKKNEEFNQLQALLINTQQENKSLQMNLTDQENSNSVLHEEVHRLQEINNATASNISSLQDQNNHYKMSLELTKKDNKVLESKLNNFKDLAHQMQLLKESYEKLIIEKSKLENDLANKTLELDDAIHSINLTKKVSEELENKLKDTESLKEDLHNVDDAYRLLIKEQQRLQSELNDKRQELNNLLQSYNSLKIDLEKVKHQTFKEVQGLSNEVASLKKAFNELLVEKNALQIDYDSKTKEIDDLFDTFQSKIDENKELSRQLQLLETNHKTVQKSMTTLQEEHYSIKNTLEALRRESDELLNRVKYYETLESEYEKLKKDHDQVKTEKSMLQKQLNMQIAELRKVSEDNHALNSESQHLLSHSEDLEKALINARTQLMNNISKPDNLHKDIIKEIEEMRKDKIENETKIRNFLDQLDKSENVIADLSEGVIARDGKIAILENHINELQDEVKRLHASLAEIVDTGEMLKENSYQKIRDSLMIMEAHHSRATHNMKMELAKLKNENVKLEEHLSNTKFETEDASREKHKYFSELIHLQNEKEIIVADIKQLEMKSVGDSELSPEHCNVEDILCSINRIRRHLEARNSKSSSLEQTLLQLQNSYQLVQSKADEAKKIVEKEKQKILNEKEEAIKDRICMEKQLTDLKEQLEKQITHDKLVIKDLEAEILNQKLIFDKLNNSTQNYISKLKEDMQSLQDLYQSSLENISELDKKLQDMSEEENTHFNIIKQINVKLEDKSKEVEFLYKELDALKNKSHHSLGTQVLNVNTKSEESQTNEELFYESLDQNDNDDKIEKINEDKHPNSAHTNEQVLEKKSTYKNTLQQGNEVQVLTANVDPIINCDKTSYLNYKLKKLGLGRLEQYSISSIKKDTLECDNEELIIPITEKSDTENMNVIDIYNKQSMHTNSSKIIDSNYPENERDLKSPGLMSIITDFCFNTESLDTKSSLQKASNLFGSVSGLSTDKDLFIIYKDSETHKSHDKKSRETKGQPKVLVKAVTILPEKDNGKTVNENHVTNNRNKHGNEKSSFFHTEHEKQNEHDNTKRKLKISLPRVENDSLSNDTASDGDKKSVDSYTLSIYPTVRSLFSLSEHKMEKDFKFKCDKQSPSGHSVSNLETQYVESQISTEGEEILARSVNKKVTHDKNNLSTPSRTTKKDNLLNENVFEVKKRLKSDSHHRLSRIDADVHLIKSKVAVPASKKDKQRVNYGLDYILASARRDPNDIKTYSAADSLRKTCSYELFDLVKLQGKSDSSPSRLSEVIKSSIDQKTVSSNNQFSFNSTSKTYTEQSVMVRLDSIEEYENQIKNLKNNLENIEKDYKKKIEAIKIQYDSNIKSILNEHNEGVKSIQCLHEETLQDMIKHHENEVENLRSMSIEAMRKADKLEKEVRSLKDRMPVCNSTCFNEEQTQSSNSGPKKHRKSRADTKILTKTNVEAFDVRPKSRFNGPCTCSLDINLSDTIRNIFEQVNADQKKVAEHTYLKYIANKILKNTVEALDCEELSFLHLKVCKIWKVKSSKEENLQKKIDALESELIKKQRFNQRDITELDRKVAEEKRRLQEAREAVCRQTVTRYDSPDSEAKTIHSPLSHTTETDYVCNCKSGAVSLSVGERRSAGDLDLESLANASLRPKRRPENSTRAVLVKLDAVERREKKFYNDEPPTRLRRLHDRHPPRSHKK